MGNILLCAQSLENDEKYENTNSILGLFLVFLSCFFFGCLIIAEEKIITEHKINVTLLAGFEGLYSMMISILVLPIYNMFSI